MIRRLLSLFTRRGWVAGPELSEYLSRVDVQLDKDYPFAPVSARAVALMWEDRSRLWLLFVLAVGMLPFALTSYNGATLLGVVAVLTFIALTIAAAPTKAPNHENGE